jgi:hypothetical protein
MNPLYLYEYPRDQTHFIEKRHCCHEKYIV